MFKPENPSPFEDPKNKIADAANQLIQFKYLPDDFEKVKEIIRNTEIKTLEEYTGITSGELERVKPGVVSSYNSLISWLKDPELTHEEFDEIMREAYEVTH